MKTLWLILIAALLSPIAAGGESLRIATYNVNWANTRGDQVLDAIATADADLICFQETTPQSERYLRHHLAETYPFFHSTGHDGSYAAERFAFASKVELSEVLYTPPDEGLFGFFTARFHFADRTVHVVNVHLTPVRVPRGGGIAEARAALSASEAIHAAEIDAVVAAIDPELPTIVLGDFNSISTFKAPQRLEREGLVDAFASVHDDADSHPTWHWPARPLPVALRIDYIFHSEHFTTNESNIIRRDGSDHSLVVAELLWKASPEPVKE